MAKWGKGDPRWIVEERADATNVNNWHWTEKNATAWSKEKLKSLLEGFIIEDNSHFCEIKELTKIEGEASANNRKAKLFFFYEWELNASWKGHLKSDREPYSGTLTIPNLSEEHSPDEVDIDVSVEKNDDQAERVKNFMRVKGIELIRKQLAIYIKTLKEEFSMGMILPTREPANGQPESTDVTVKTVEKNLSKQTISKETPKSVTFTCITDQEEFKCPACHLYRALTDGEMVKAFTMGAAEVESRVGGKFSLFGGNVTGEFTELTPDKRVGMRWRFVTWPSDHYSTVVLDLNQKDDCTELRLTQSGVPTNEYEKTVDGWKNYYWQSIKRTFGFGASLY